MKGNLTDNTELTAWNGCCGQCHISAMVSATCLQISRMVESKKHFKEHLQEWQNQFQSCHPRWASKKPYLLTKVVSGATIAANHIGGMGKKKALQNDNILECYA